MRPDSPQATNADLEQRLTDGYAQAHELETLALQLEREGTQMLVRGESAEQLRSVMRQRRDVERELDRLRASLEALRGAPNPLGSNKGPSA
jgi:hypothetical protein